MDKIEATKLHSCMISQLCLMVLLVVTFSATADINGRIVRVLDGDTVEVLETDNQLTRVRLAGIDAPEKSQPFGQRSRQALASMVAQRTVTVTGTDMDRYGRLLGTVWLGKADVNAAQIRNGLAWAYRFHGKAIRDDYVTLEDEARRQATGLWSVAGQTEPRQPGGCKLKTAPVRPVVAARPAEYVCSEDLFY